MSQTRAAAKDGRRCSEDKSANPTKRAKRDPPVSSANTSKVVPTSSPTISDPSHTAPTSGGKVRSPVKADGLNEQVQAAVKQTVSNEDAARFCVIRNDGKDVNLIRLIHLKNIFSKQLPKMPPQYILRLVFDRRHESLVILRGNEVLGGICYRMFHEQRFAEIAFCAIKATEQVKGWGTKLMNQVKEHMKPLNIEYFLTYADNYAIGYFQKQGFTRRITLPRERYIGYIKDYDGGTLMECFIHPKINYNEIPVMIKKQREFLYDRIRSLTNSQVVYPGLTCFGGRDNLAPAYEDPYNIPGIKEAGWTRPEIMVAQKSATASLVKALGSILGELRAQKYAWAFLEPVDTVAYPDYKKFIKNPIDISEIQRRVDAACYASKKDFLEDIKLMCNNCKAFNSVTSSYYRDASRVLKFVLQRLEAIVESSPSKLAVKTE